MAKIAPATKKTLEIPKVLEKPPQINQSKAWRMYFDGAQNNLDVGASVALKSLDGAVFKHCLKLNFPTTNNEDEYKAFIAGLWSTIKLKVIEFHIFSDLKLVVNQVTKKI